AGSTQGVGARRGFEEWSRKDAPAARPGPGQAPSAAWAAPGGRPRGARALGAARGPLPRRARPGGGAREAPRGVRGGRAGRL
ncbi:MAG: hypothetical protein AVDCRST_MAG05-4632, partial [uncultured Rubrobacteraceae bacterium]